MSEITHVKWLDKLLDFKKHAVYSVPALLCIFGIITFVSKRKQQSDQAFLNAMVSFSSWKSGGVPKALKSAMSAQPELHAVYDHVIVQRMLGSDGDAKPYLKKVLKRAAPTHPYYARFSNASCSIADGKYLEALNSSLALAEEMEADSVFLEGKEEEAPYGEALFSFNLLRIAMLHEKLDHEPEAKEAYLSVLAHLNGDVKGYEEGFRVLGSHLTDGEYTLKEFIESKV